MSRSASRFVNTPSAMRAGSRRSKNYQARKWPFLSGVEYPQILERSRPRGVEPITAALVRISRARAAFRLGGYMIKPEQGLTWTIGILSVFILAASGCASKKYVNQQ